jgi:hypothetical protein
MVSTPLKLGFDFPLDWIEPCEVKWPPGFVAWGNKARVCTHDSELLYSLYRRKYGRRYVEN